MSHYFCAKCFGQFDAGYNYCPTCDPQIGEAQRAIINSVPKHEYKVQEGTWTLIAPDGRKWTGGSPLRAIGAESRERIPAEVRLKRIFAAIDDDGSER